MIGQPRDDMVVFLTKIIFSRKHQGLHTDKDLQQTHIDDLSLILTRRIILSQVASIYDPLRLTILFLLTVKLI